ncbi:HDOD domain-containing protein [Thalassoglobus sp. JC818]|uniref:HDOD domain-containing protein n=1 Tax=Thalassoglobus sp. JC818 TaxID=3232136 RepID=UPI00345894FC
MVNQKFRASSASQPSGTEELQVSHRIALLEELASQDDFTWNSIASRVQADAELASRVVMEAATAGRHGELLREIQSIEHATALLGINWIQNLLVELTDEGHQEQKAA